jgi:hypothetical protein
MLLCVVANRKSAFNVVAHDISPDGAMMSLFARGQIAMGMSLKIPEVGP